MWRFRKCMVNTVVHVNKLEDWLGIKCTVSDLWQGGDMVKSFNIFFLNKVKRAFVEI